MNAGRLLLLGTLLAAIAAPASAADDGGGEALGRLFFTPERRAVLDRQRALNIQESQQVEDPTVTVNGVVRRSSGRDTAWINGAPQNAEAPGAIWSGSLPAQPASVRVTPPGETTRQVKVGETLYRGSGDITTPLHGGQITVREARSPAAAAQRP